MPHTIGIIAFDDVLTSEVIAPVEVFANAIERGLLPDARVLLIGVEPQMQVRTAEGIRLAVDCTVANAPDLTVLIVPGANDVDALMQHAALNAFIRKHADAAEYVASVCAGAFLLGSAGVLDGKQATTWFGGESSLQAQFPQVNVVFDAPVVSDQRVITANGGLVAYRAALVLLARLTSADAAEQVYRGLGIDRLGTWAAIVESIA